MDNSGIRIIQNLLQIMGDGKDWRQVDDLRKLPSGDAKIAILQQHFPSSDVASMNRDQVAEELLSLYWGAIHADSIESPAAVEAFLHLVLQVGLRQAALLVQQFCDLPADGMFGPQTLRAINAMNGEEFAMRCNKALLDFLRNRQRANANDAEQKMEDINSASLKKAPRKKTTKQRAQSKPAAEPGSPPPSQQLEFNVDAIAKKSTSDIWTIDDQLGYQTYAHSIAKLILENKAEPPLTVSIQAPWGQGKTSLMRMIKHKLENGLQESPREPSGENPKDKSVQSSTKDLEQWMETKTTHPQAMLSTKTGTIPCVWFNPLYYENSNQIWAGLAHSILHQLAEKLPNQKQREEFWFRLRLTRVNTDAIRQDIHKLIFARLLPRGLFWFSVLLFVMALQLLDLISGKGILGWLLNLFPVACAAIDFARKLSKENKDFAIDDKLEKYIREPNYEGDLGLLYLVEHDLDRALKLLIGEQGRLVVFIDDLDRCTPDTVNEILLAINQFISVHDRHIYFILGMDTHMVAMAIETAADKQADTYNKNRHSSKGYGWRFMEKFVQLPFFIPRISPSEAEKYLDSLLRTNKQEKIEPAAVEELINNIHSAVNLADLVDVVKEFKEKHKVDFVPKAEEQVADKMIDMTSTEDSETLNKLVNAAVQDLELNPREMKRFLNVARLLFIRIGRDQNVGSNEHMLKVVRASHLILNWPQCLRWLQGNAQSFTVKGEKQDPVAYMKSLLGSAKGKDFPSWKKAITEDWGAAVAETIAQADFYAFAKRIHQDQPNLSDIFAARIF